MKDLVTRYGMSLRQVASYPCSCCGMSWTDKDKVPKNANFNPLKGIRVVNGFVGKDKETLDIKRTNVVTKNGNLSVIIRKQHGNS